MAERSGRERGRLDDDRGHREEVGVSVEGERNGAELGSKSCVLYTVDEADDRPSVDSGGSRMYTENRTETAPRP